jgi:hypothetical protein
LPSRTVSSLTRRKNGASRVSKLTPAYLPYLAVDIRTGIIVAHKRSFTAAPVATSRYHIGKNTWPASACPWLVVHLPTGLLCQPTAVGQAQAPAFSRGGCCRYLATTLLGIGAICIWYTREQTSEASPIKRL